MKAFSAIADDIRNMQEYEFFQEYYNYIKQLLDNLEKFKQIEESNGLVKKLIEQGSTLLEEYLIYIHKEKVALVEYVYDKYKEVLEEIASMNSKFVNKELSKIKFSLKVWESNKQSILIMLYNIEGLRTLKR